jgi:hypothetical protein
MGRETLASLKAENRRLSTRCAELAESLRYTSAALQVLREQLTRSGYEAHKLSRMAVVDLACLRRDV